MAATPGKTKHFQTHFLTENLILCDSPGIVFPSFTNSKAELVCNGTLPLDHLKEHVSPIALIC